MNGHLSFFSHTRKKGQGKGFIKVLKIFLSLLLLFPTFPSPSLPLFISPFSALPIFLCFFLSSFSSLSLSLSHLSLSLSLYLSHISLSLSLTYLSLLSLSSLSLPLSLSL